MREWFARKSFYGEGKPAPLSVRHPRQNLTGW